MEGALDLTINGAKLITPVMWDYIDELWAYLLDSLEDLTSGNTAEMYFPDQPIRLAMKRVEPGFILVSISSSSQKFDNAVQVQESDLLSCLAREGERFFARIMELAPQGSDQYQEELDRFRNLRSRYPGP